MSCSKLTDDYDLARVRAGFLNSCTPTNSENAPTATTRNVSIPTKNHSRKPSIANTRPSYRSDHLPREGSTAPGHGPSAGLCCPAMDTPKEDTENEPPKDENDETKPANGVESYESEWYEVLKRRAEELEAAGESGEDEGEAEDADA